MEAAAVKSSYGTFSGCIWQAFLKTPCQDSLTGVKAVLQAYGFVTPEVVRPDANQKREQECVRLHVSVEEIQPGDMVYFAEEGAGIQVHDDGTLDFVPCVNLANKVFA